jgi:outer membrane protein assembly factor BamB
MGTALPQRRGRPGTALSAGLLVACTVFGACAQSSFRSPTVLWSFTTGGAVDSSPAVVGGVVYVGSDDHQVYALDA